MISSQRPKTALVVVDVQHDFVDGSLAVSGAHDVVPTIQSLITVHGPSASPWDMVVYTRDDHPQGHVSFASRHNLPPFLAKKVDAEGRITDGENSDAIEQVLWPDHCVHGTRGAALVPGIRSALDELSTRSNGPEVVDLPKGQMPNEDFYSAFASVDYTSFTPLVRVLAKAGIERLVVCGLATDYCVCSTAVDARKFGFDTILVQDAVAGVAQDTATQAIELMRSKGCRLVDTQRLLQELGAHL